MRAKLIDISTHQDDSDTPKQFDFTKPRTFGVNGIIIRTGHGMVKDADYEYYYRDAKAAGYYLGTYHFDDYDVNLEKQVFTMLAAMEGKAFDLPPAWDIEDSSQPFHATQTFALSRAKGFFAIVEPVVHKICAYYMGASMIRWLKPVPGFLRMRRGWPAWYPKRPAGNPFNWMMEHVGPDTGGVPWWLWQGSAKGNGFGAAMGADGSADIDCDVSSLPYTEFYADAAQTIVYPDYRPARIKTSGSFVRVRKTPQFGDNICYSLLNNTRVNVFGESNGFYKVDFLASEWVHGSVLSIG